MNEEMDFMNNGEMNTVAQFDFADIKDDDAVEPVEVEDELSFDDEEEFDDSDDIAEDEDDIEEVDDITDALSKLETIPDDFELNFGSAKVNKGELVELLNAREEVTKTREAISGFAMNLAAKEEAVSIAFDVAKTETDKQLDHVYSMLNDPNKWNSSTDVAQLQKARIQLEARKSELDKKGNEARAAIAEQKQQAVVFNIQKVAKEVGQESLTKAAKFAESRGMDMDALVNGISPALVKALNDAQKYEELLNKNKARLDKAVQDKKPRSTSTKAKTTSRSAASEKKRAQALYRQGKLSHADMFNFLDD